MSLVGAVTLQYYRMVHQAEMLHTTISLLQQRVNIYTSVSYKHTGTLGTMDRSKAARSFGGRLLPSVIVELSTSPLDRNIELITASRQIQHEINEVTALNETVEGQNDCDGTVFEVLLYLDAVLRGLQYKAFHRVVLRSLLDEVVSNAL